MILALAGRRIDAADAAVERFPPRMEAPVRQRLRDLLVQRAVTALVASAACGADLLALDAAGELGLRRRVVLPFDPAAFRRTSVTDRPDPARWGRLFDGVVRVLPPHDLVVLHAVGEGTAAYAAATDAILDEAVALARAEGDPHGVLAAVVWEGRPRGEDDLTAAFALQARARGIEVTEVRTL